MAKPSGVIVSPFRNTEGTEVYLAVQIPRSMDIEGAKARLARLTWADNEVRIKAGRPGRTLLVQAYKPARNISQFEKQAGQIATCLFGLDGFDGNIDLSFMNS